MAIIYKDINTLTQKSSINGTEKLPIGHSKYITSNQLVSFFGLPDTAQSAEDGSSMLVTDAASIETSLEFALENNRYEIEIYNGTELCTKTSHGQYRLDRETGCYSLSGYAVSKHAIIYMEPGDYILIKAKSNQENWFAFVTDYTKPVATAPIPFAGTSNIKTVNAGETRIYKAPVGTRAARVSIGADPTWTYCPEKVIVYRDKLKLDMELLKGNGKREVLLAPINYTNEITGNNGFCFRIRKGYGYLMTTEMTYTGSDIYKHMTISDNIPQGFGSINYFRNNSTNSNVTYGSNFYNFENWEENYGGMPGYGVLLSESANCTFINTKVYEIDPYSKSSWWSRISNPSMKAFASGLQYNEVNLRALPIRDYGINAPLDQYGTSTTSKRILIPVQEGQFVKMIFPTPHENWGVRNLFWFTEIDTPSPKGKPPIVNGTGGFSTRKVVSFEHDNGYELYVQAPLGAKYLSMYIGNSGSYDYAPTYLGVSITSGSGGINSSDQKADNSNLAIGYRYLSQGIINSLNQVSSIPVDSNGWEIPQTIQQLNTIKKSKQCINIKWTPKHDIPGKNITYTANVQRTSLPYSSASEYAKNLGTEVSLNTFMTAVNNPYSLLYTENISEASSTSAWGYSYHGSNGATYYGQVCCAFSAFANGQPTTYNNPDIPRNATMYGVFVPIQDRHNANSYKIGDVGNNQAHSFVIMGLKRNSSGNVVTIRLAESTSGSFNGNRYRDLTPANFYTYIDREGDPFYMYRISNYYKNVDYKPCKYFPLTEYGESTAASYNNDICTFAGDEACFMEGDLVVINYNLTSTPSRTWTSIEVYKDDELYGSYTLSSIDQSTLADSQKNHALNLGTTLPGGMYKARLKDASSNYSDYTYWEIIPNTMSITNNNDGSWTFSADQSTPIIFIWIGTDRWNFFVQRFARELDWQERQRNSVTLYIDKTMRDWGREDPTLDGNQVRLLFKGTYGTAVKVMNIPGRHN